MRKPPTHLLYLHGFRSSPQSAKARRMAAWAQTNRPDLHWWCPQLPPSPREAMAMLDDTLRHWPTSAMAVIGSSLGGFYATAVAERLGCPAVLLNPAVDPARDLEKYIGEQTAWHDPAVRFFFRPEFITELQALDPGPARAPAAVQTWVAQGDEVLDWREMAARHAATELHVLDGDDHALSSFDTHRDAMLRFLRLLQQG
jgi:predicted esterase YcpF (UPF0227 family)